MELMGKKRNKANNKSLQAHGALCVDALLLAEIQCWKNQKLEKNTYEKDRKSRGSQPWIGTEVKRDQRVSKENFMTLSIR